MHAISLSSFSSSLRRFGIIFTSFTDLSYFLYIKKYEEYENMISRHSSFSIINQSTSIIGTISTEKLDEGVICTIMLASLAICNIGITVECEAGCSFPWVTFEQMKDKEDWIDAEEFLQQIESFLKRTATYSYWTCDLQIHDGTRSYKVRWALEPTLSKTSWSRDAFHNGDCFLVTLHITIPYIFTTGRWTCSSM